MTAAMVMSDMMCIENPLFPKPCRDIWNDVFYGGNAVGVQTEIQSSSCMLSSFNMIAEILHRATGLQHGAIAVMRQTIRDEALQAVNSQMLHQGQVRTPALRISQGKQARCLL